MRFSMPTPADAGSIAQVQVAHQAELDAIERYCLLTNYLAAAQIYLKDNFLLKEPLKPEHIKDCLLERWGTSPGINLIYAHLNCLIQHHDISLFLIAGTGRETPAMLANLYLERSLQAFYPELTLDANGLANLIIAESFWESFTVTLKKPAFFDKMIKFSGNQPGTGGLVTFKDSNWLMSIVLAYQPHFINQPADVQVFWGYALFPDRVGDFVPKPMTECNGAEILQELCGHLRFDLDTVASANCIPCRMPYITSMFMPRLRTDLPLPIPHRSKNLAFISQFVEIPDDVVFTVEYSVRTAQMAVYAFLGIVGAASRNENHPIPPVSPHDKSLRVQFEALIKAFK